jgi:hypothetical protein
MNSVTMSGVNINNININSINNKKFTDLYNKFIKDLESLKSFYFNRYILELEFGTINFIIGELLISIKNFNNLFNNGSNISSYSNIIKVKFNNLRLLVNKLILIIGINFNDGKSNKVNVDEFVCNNDEYNLNFFNTNKENYNTIKILNNKFKIITQNIVDITKNNKLIMDNIQINIIFNKIKGEIDTINNLINYSIPDTNSNGESSGIRTNSNGGGGTGTNGNGGSNTGTNGNGNGVSGNTGTNGNGNTGTNSNGASSNTGTNGNGNGVSGNTGTNGNGTTGTNSNGASSNTGTNGNGNGGGDSTGTNGNGNGVSGTNGNSNGGGDSTGTNGDGNGGGSSCCNITFKQFCSLNNKKKIKVIIIKIIDIMKKISIIDIFKQLNFVNAMIITFIFLSIYYG